jgi:mRNA-degrading endonuclease RelE of RelBE toxin-antitoxin system
MTWRLVWTRPALRDLKKLDSVIARRVRRALVTLSTTGRGDVVKLKGVRPPEWRLRIGDYRAFFQLDENERLINVLRVRRRDQAY